MGGILSTSTPYFSEFSVINEISRQYIQCIRISASCANQNCIIPGPKIWPVHTPPWPGLRGSLGLRPRAVSNPRPFAVGKASYTTLQADQTTRKLVHGSPFGAPRRAAGRCPVTDHIAAPRRLVGFATFCGHVFSILYTIEAMAVPLSTRPHSAHDLRLRRSTQQLPPVPMPKLATAARSNTCLPIPWPLIYVQLPASPAISSPVWVQSVVLGCRERVRYPQGTLRRTAPQHPQRCHRRTSQWFPGLMMIRNTWAGWDTRSCCCLLANSPYKRPARWQQLGHHLCRSIAAATAESIAQTTAEAVLLGQTQETRAGSAFCA